jgi:hypothetical protein
MIFSPFIGFSPARGYDADRFSPHGVHDDEKATARHAHNDETLFPVIFSVVDFFNGERVLENVPRSFEADAVLGVVGSGLVIIPLETSIAHQHAA